MQILITGANRGIGFALTKEYLERGESVIATTRSLEKAVDLNSFAKAHNDSLRIEILDIAEEESIGNLAARLEGATIDILINNAGVKIDSETFFDTESLNASWRVNVLGTVGVLDALLPLILRSERKLIANVSSQMASIHLAGADSMPYRISKAALNMATKIYANRLKREDVTVVAVHPGWVRTEMGGSAAPINTQNSAQKIVKLLGGLGPHDSGRFLNAQDPQRDLPW